MQLSMFNMESAIEIKLLLLLLLLLVAQFIETSATKTVFLLVSVTKRFTPLTFRMTFT